MFVNSLYGYGNLFSRSSLKTLYYNCCIWKGRHCFSEWLVLKLVSKIQHITNRIFFFENPLNRFLTNFFTQLPLRFYYYDCKTCKNRIFQNNLESEPDISLHQNLVTRVHAIAKVYLNSVMDSHISYLNIKKKKFYLLQSA